MYFRVNFEVRSGYGGPFLLVNAPAHFYFRAFFLKARYRMGILGGNKFQIFIWERLIFLIFSSGKQYISEISSKATKTLGFLRRNLAFAPRSTKEVAYKTLVRPKLEYAAPIWSPYSKLQINQIEKVQRTAARWTCRRWRNTSSVGEMLDELEWPSLEARRDQSSLLLFHKIHSGAVSIEKDKYLTPARSLKSTRSSHSAQYCRYQTYSDALKNSFFPRTIPQWNSLSPSAVNSQTAEEFRALLI